MKVYETKSSIQSLYYLMAVDKNIGEDELVRFCEIGEELDRKNFNSYKESIIESCQKHISSGEPDDDYYDVIMESLDFALRHTAKRDDQGVTGRLLVWNMLAIAFSNKEYDATEKKLISHVARVSDVPKDVFLDMEQSMQAAMAIQKELVWIQNSNRPYNEVRPVVDDLENRLAVILGSAKALIEDEVILDDPFEDNPDFIDKAKGALDEAMAPVLDKVGDAAKNVGDVAVNVGEAVAEAVSGAWKGLFGKKKPDSGSKEEK